MLRLVLVLVVAGCSGSSWTGDECFGSADAGAPIATVLGDEICVELGPTGGIAGYTPEATVDGDCLTLVDDAAIGDQGDAPDGMSTGYLRYEATAVGGCTVTVAQRNASEPDFVLEFEVRS